MPYPKTKSLLPYLLIISPLFTLAQKTPKNIIGTYSYSDGHFFYQLELKKDSTFTYQFSFKLGSTSSCGKWKYNNDTLYVFDYEKPYTIKYVREKVLDTLGKTSVIDVVFGNTKPRGYRSDYVFVDGERVELNPDTTTKREIVTYFKIWINNNCNTQQVTDKLGRVKFTDKKIKTISTDYENYIIKNPASNYFIVALSNYPLFVSPPTLLWEKWLLTKNTLSPIECNKKLNYIELKK